MQPLSTNIFLYTALPCEAKPLIDSYTLKKDTSVKAFSVFHNDEITLTVTGVGKTAMSAGIAYTQALFSSTPNPIMLNVGIAGHNSHAIGSAFLIDKITDADSGRRYYPPLAFTPPCLTHGLFTFAKQQLTYPDVNLCDMEAAAFYETATRFTSGELAQCLKIVSDNQASPAHNIQPKQVSELISTQLPTIDRIVLELKMLADTLAIPESPEFGMLLKHYHFTTNEQIQLKKLVSRWQLIKGERKIEITDGLAKNGKEFLKILTQQLNEAAFDL
jgi:adenosylhomocysteine nucleosidase